MNKKLRPEDTQTQEHPHDSKNAKSNSMPADPQAETKGTTKAPNIHYPPAIYPALAIGLGYFLQRFVPLPKPTHDSFNLTGLVFFAAGILLIGWSLRCLQKFKTTALPHRAASHLISSGPYRFSRNPIYLAFLLLVMASALTTGNLWILISVPVVMLLLSIYVIHPEEVHLRLSFGEEFEAYSYKVRRWL